jgi:hypothetical protein
MELSRVPVKRAQVHRHDPQSLALDPGQDITDEPSPYAVGFDQDQGTFSHEFSFAEEAVAPTKPRRETDRQPLGHLDPGLFHAGRYAEAVEAQMRSENLTKVQYPSDSTEAAPDLRLALPNGRTSRSVRPVDPANVRIAVFECKNVGSGCALPSRPFSGGGREGRDHRGDCNAYRREHEHYAHGR